MSLDAESPPNPPDLNNKEKLGFVLFCIVFNALLILVIEGISRLFGYSIL